MTDSHGGTDGGSGEPVRIRDDYSFPEGTFNDWLGLDVEELGDGESVIAVEYEAFKRNRGGILHGGVTATLVDVAAAMAIRSALEDPNRAMATTNLEVNYLRPVTDRAAASAEVVRTGSSNAVARVDVRSTNPDGEPTEVAVGTVTYQFL